MTAAARREVLDAAAKPFLAAIAANPGVALHRLIFADFLEEMGCDAEAQGQRWLAREGKYPQAGFGLTGGWYSDNAGGIQPHARLPFAFVARYDSDVVADSHGNDLVGCERIILRRCGELRWEGGEPVGEATELEANR